ncbi:MAG: 1-methylthio-xylulose 5-phosphate sulfo-lyase [Immundisolibacter sp.]
MNESQSRVLRAEQFTWPQVPLRVYKNDGSSHRDITRRTLLGEGVGEEALDALVRYFEIQPGGYSTLERHQHPHAVVVLRGRGSVILDRQVTPVTAGDCVYVAPQCFHQFHADAGEVLGFLCVVSRERDRPVLPTAQELARLREVPAVARLLRA